MQRFEQNKLVKSCLVLLVALGIVETPVARADTTDIADTAVIPSEALQEFLEDVSLDKLSNVALDGIALPDPEPRLIAFARDCASLDAIPLVEIRKDDDRRIFVGVNFDGIFGIHGQL